MICINNIWKDDDKNKEKKIDNNIRLAEKLSNNNEGESIIISENSLEKRLEDILKNMNGVQDAKVLITYTETEQIVPMYNEKHKETVTLDKKDEKKTEKDLDKEVVFEEKGSEKKPVLQSRKLPKLEGAIVTAKGSENIEIKANIIKAVEAATRVSI